MAKLLIALAVICAALVQVSARNHMTLRFYNGSTTDEYVDYPSHHTAEEVLDHSAWNWSKPTMFYVHGFNETYESESAITIASAFLKHSGYNVLTLDWAPSLEDEGHILNLYGAYLMDADGYGEAMGEMLNRFVKKGVSPSSVTLIGYSSGAHVVGPAARAVDGTIARIIALDPIYQGVNLFGVKNHLLSTDARSVEVYHTNMELMGFPTPLGTVDFYPNQGYPLQPGCSYSETSDLFICSSDVSWKLFAESVNNPTAFKSINCDSWTEFQRGRCSGPTEYMGFGVSQNATGNFYLQTNSASPYSKGDDGIVYDGSDVNTLSLIRIRILVYSTFLEIFLPIYFPG